MKLESVAFSHMSNMCFTADAGFYPKLFTCGMDVEAITSKSSMNSEISELSNGTISKKPEVNVEDQDYEVNGGGENTKEDVGPEDIEDTANENMESMLSNDSEMDDDYELLDSFDKSKEELGDM